MTISRMMGGLALLVAAQSVTAQEAMSPEAFDAYTQGKTLNFAFQGQIYGAEIYRDNRRVTWSFLDGNCQDGTWYGEGDQICFLYENSDGPSCWRFFLTGGGLRAEFVSETDPFELYETSERSSEMLCYGPEVGV